MMHVYLRGSAEALVRANAEIARSEKVLLFRRLMPTGVPGVAAFELSIGDAADDISDREIHTYFTRMMTIAGDEFSA
jgi:hypothetical protein